MRGALGLVSLLIVFAVVALLAKKQLGAPSASMTGAAENAATPQQRSDQLQKQIGQTVESTLQQARPVQDDK
jgi:hypothetical protein